MKRIKPIKQPRVNSTGSKLAKMMVDFAMTKQPSKAPNTFKWLFIDDALWQEVLADQEKRRVRQEIKRLEQQKMVKLKSKANKAVHVLTEEGKVVVLRELMKQRKRVLPKGVFVYVMFDIPENVKYVRNMIRSIIKENDFELEQLSVWKTNRDIAYPFQEIINIAGLEKWVKIVEGTDLNFKYLQTH